MKKLFFVSLLATIFLFPNLSLAEDYGVVMDISGSVELISNGKKSPVDLGTNLSIGDEISLNKDSSLVVVSYEDCLEWKINGPNKIKVSAAIHKDKKKVTILRQLPVCYSPSEMNTSDSQSIGGFVLRGMPVDPLEQLRNEFKSGKASNSTLMTLIMHDVNNKEINKAKPYYSELKQRMPNSSFIKEIKKYFVK